MEHNITLSQELALVTVCLSYVHRSYGNAYSELNLVVKAEQCDGCSY